MSTNNIALVSSQNKVNQPINLKAKIQERALKWREESLASPLAGLPRPEVQEMGREFAIMLGFGDDESKHRLFETAAIVAQVNDIWKPEKRPLVTDNNGWGLTEQDFQDLEAEATGGWRELPRSLWQLMAVCCLCAVMQGHNE